MVGVDSCVDSNFSLFALDGEFPTETASSEGPEALMVPTESVEAQVVHHTPGALSLRNIRTYKLSDDGAAASEAETIPQITSLLDAKETLEQLTISMGHLTEKSAQVLADVISKLSSLKVWQFHFFFRALTPHSGIRFHEHPGGESRATGCCLP